MFTYLWEEENEACSSELPNQEMMYFTMLLSGQAQADAAGDLNQNRPLLLPSESQVKQKGITV